MADRRMFTRKVTDDDNFMALSSSAQALYLHLSMSADDDGFCNQVSLSMFKAHASVQDLEALLEKRYIYQFENGVIVIKHWRMANALRKDRYTKTTFQEELSQLRIKDNGVYTLNTDGNHLATTWQPNGNHLATQNSIEKNRIDKVNNKKSEIDAMIDDYTENLILRSSLIEFAKSRKALRKPMTSNAMKLILSKLDKLASTDQEKIAIVEQSIERGWAGVFPIEHSKKPQKEEKQQSYDLDEWDSFADDFLKNLQKE